MNKKFILSQTERRSRKSRGNEINGADFFGSYLRGKHGVGSNNYLITGNLTNTIKQYTPRAKGQILKIKKDLKNNE